MANKGNNWHPLESCGKTILFLTKEEADSYLQGWKAKQTTKCQAFVSAEAE